ncbi:MAG: hypothetical protein NC305_02265 [Lachnospiraceae bacterium]|nr:hypothetical protein [Muribaculaceae bacterium]MCM1409355.1 hypothetical protein [Lachnospiraceae bacterium]
MYEEDSLNVGWLEKGHPFSTGSVPEEFMEKLWKYFRYPVQVCRGYHVCDLCENPDIMRSVPGEKTEPCTPPPV